jgi:cell division transport system ATP-binding protein
MVRFEKVNFSYASKNIFQDITLEINKGEFVFIVGESGIGKTTFLKLIYFDLKPEEGTVKFDDFNSQNIDFSEIPALRRKIGIVFQDFKLLNDRNVQENIALPLYIRGEKKESVKKKVYDIASNLGILDTLRKMPYDVSGGEQQRVAIARAMIANPVLLIADEPTGNLDPFVSYEIVKLLNEINKSGTTLIMATHNFEIVKKFGNKRILQIKDKKIVDVRIKN